MESKTSKIIVMLIFSISTAIAWFGVGYSLAVYDFRYGFASALLESPGDYENPECFQVYDIETASLCLRDWVKGFYNYTIREDTIKTLDDIKLNGGDCFDYTMLYKTYLDSNDYITQDVHIYTKEDGHTFLIAFDNEMKKYCKLDQLSIDCLDLGSGDYDEKNETN